LQPNLAGTARPILPTSFDASDPSDSASFDSLGLPSRLVRAIADEGYETPTAIQCEAIPHVLEGRDLLATAKTGTGKTAAFLLPILARLGDRPRPGIRALVISPTRELASQIAERAEAYARHTDLTHAVVYGGVSQREQERSLRRKPSLLVATPGRLLDLMRQRVIRLDEVETLVLDEADRMFDMGFLPDVRHIVSKLSPKRQTLLFSATMPGSIKRLAESILTDPVRIAVDPPDETPDVVDQSVYFLKSSEKRALLLRLLRDGNVDRALIFTRTKRGANRLAEELSRGGISADAIHGDKSQGARESALSAFRSGQTPVLVATDVAARGIDVKGITHVFNYELPDSAESYVHRVGRTGRAGASGKAISLCDPTERGQLYEIERTLKVRIPEGSQSPDGPSVAREEVRHFGERKSVRRARPRW
jgi:ATP-dependent RNA helicase RhlE